MTINTDITLRVNKAIFKEYPRAKDSGGDGLLHTDKGIKLHIYKYDQIYYQGMQITLLTALSMQL